MDRETLDQRISGFLTAESIARASRRRYEQALDEAEIRRNAVIDGMRQLGVKSFNCNGNTYALVPASEAKLDISRRAADEATPDPKTNP